LQKVKNTDAEVSVLLLHVQAAADYYTMNQTLMGNVPPVLVEIILDPYIFNAIPRSLVPTIGYIVVLVAGSWFLAKYISGWIQNLGRGDVDARKKIA
jgi:hypothetical protein